MLSQSYDRQFFTGIPHVISPSVSTTTDAQRVKTWVIGTLWDSSQKMLTFLFKKAVIDGRHHH